MSFEVSVIIPTYNAGSIIEKTIKSLINQSFKDFEIIFVDDNSSDNTVNIIRNTLSDRDISYTIIENEKSLGASGSRNIGLRNVSGKYIIFVDDDDYLDKDHIQNLYNGIYQNNADFGFTKLMKVDADNNYLSSNQLYEEIENLDLISVHDFLKLEFLMRISFNFVQLIYPTRIIKDYNILFDEDSVYGEDTEFAIKALIHGKSIGISKDFTYFYLQHSKSVSHSISLERFQFINTLENLKGYFKDYDNNSEDLVDLITTNRIPKAIFGNLMYLFYENNCSFDEINNKMNELDLFNKLKMFKPYDNQDNNFNRKIKLFLIYPKLYYKLWKRFKNSI
jgi:glycosyltransferase involved in cell wall biosynthesis